MAEPRHGLLAEFADARALVTAMGEARARGHRRLEAFSPFPLEALEPADRRVSYIALGGGLLGAALGLLMQVGGSLDYPLDIGGRPLLAWPSFITVTFVLAVLFAVLATVLGLLLCCRLPRLNHPLFEAEAFARASEDRFLLLVVDEPPFSRADTAVWLAGRALSVDEVTL